MMRMELPVKTTVPHAWKSKRFVAQNVICQTTCFTFINDALEAKDL